MAAALAQGWMDSSGNSLKYSRTCLGYAVSRFWRSILASSLQYGHSKSLNVTITTGAPGVPKLGGELRLDLVQLGLEGVVVHVVDRALHDLRAVLGDQELKVLRLVAGRGVHHHVQKARQAVGGLGIEHLHGDMRIHHEQMAHIGFQRGLIERRLLGASGRERPGRSTAGPSRVRKSIETSFLFYRTQTTGPMRQGTNSLCPRRSAQVRRPEATSSIRSKISRPTCCDASFRHRRPRPR